MMIDVITLKNAIPNPYRDIAEGNVTGRIALDLTGKPFVVQRAPKLFFERTLDFIHGYSEDNVFLPHENILVTQAFIRHGKEIYGETVFDFAFPLKEQKEFLYQGLIFSTEKNKEILAKADRLFEAIQDAETSGVDRSITEAKVIAQELQKRCAALEDPNEHLSEAIKNYGNIAIHCTLLGLVLAHPIPLTTHVAIDAAEAGIFARADICEKFKQANASLSRFSSAREARGAAHDAVKTAIYDTEAYLKTFDQQPSNRMSTSSPNSIATEGSSHEDLNITALREIIISLKTTLRSLET